jgi:Lon protease-like protein
MPRHRFVCAIAAVVLLCMPFALQAQTIPVPVRGTDSLPETIPIFPLDDVFVFPNILLPLNIFEPRYREMVADALKGDRVIGMVQLRPGYEPNYEGRPPVFGIGCAGVITQVDQLPDGRYTILLRGLVKFRILSEDQSRPYRLARVEPIPEEPDEKERAALTRQRERLIALMPSAAEPVPREISDEDVINALSQYSRIDAVQRQDLLELNGPLLRSEALIKLLEKK